MVAHLTKSDASKGFNQVIDFLNGSYIKYALTINPSIYVSCIKQFWNTVAIKQVNDVTRLQALVDKKKVVVAEAAIRENLVKERFSTSKPKNFSDDFLLTTLGAMFEKPDVQDQVWKNQRTMHGQAKKEDTHSQGRFNFRRTFLTGFPVQSIRSSNVIALDSPYLLVLITGTSQSRQHESHKSPTAELFEVDSGRISIHHRKTATGKESSNPFMAVSLPKTILYSFLHKICFHMSPFEFPFVYLVVTSIDSPLLGVNTPRSDEDRLKLPELMVFLLQKGSWLVQKQTALGKDTSNPLIVDSLLKTIWFLIHHHLTIEVLAIPGQTTTGKESSNPFMAGVNTPRSNEDRLKLMELMVFLLQKGVCVDIGITAARLSSYCCQATLWNTASVKRSGDVIRLQALVDKKKIVISEAVIREILQLNDAESMGTLAIGQPAEEGLGAEQVQVDAVVEENVAEDVSHDVIPSPPPHRVKNLETANAAQKLEIVQLKARVKKLEKANKLKSSKLRHLRKVGASRRVESSDDMEDVFNQGRMIADMDMNEGNKLVKDDEVVESEGRHAEKQAEIYNLDLDHSSKVLSMQEDDLEVQEVVEIVTTAKLITEVVIAAASQVSAASTTIPAASATIPAAKPTIPAAVLTDIDWDAAMDHVNQKSSNPQYIKRYQGMKKRPQTESQARKNMMIYLKNTVGYKMDFFKGMTYAQICPIFQARFDETIRFLFKSREEMEAEDQEIIKSLNETPTQKAAKRRKLSEEAQEAKDLRKQLKIVLIDNKPRFKIIRADETHQFYISFTTLLKNFDREDLETLWRIVKNRFSTSKPTNFSDEYLLLTLRTMFEEPDGQDAIWRNQKSVQLVKRWKLLASCGVHVITLSIV
nr:hypothetical protein [Tanacetum cinerariifolium]